MDRRRTTRLLAALYGMDTRAPDWSTVLLAFVQVFQCDQVELHRLDAGHRSSRICAYFESPVSASLLPSDGTGTATLPWLNEVLERLHDDGVVEVCGGELAPSCGPDCVPLARSSRSAMAVLIGGDDDVEWSLLVLWRDQTAGRFDDDERDLARSLQPHLRNVCAWQQRFSSIDHQSERFRLALDALAEGVLMLDQDGRPMFCNAAARAMAGHRLFAWRSDGRLGLPNPRDEHQLQQALRHLGTSPDVQSQLLQIHGSHGRLMATLKLCTAPPADGDSDAVRVLAFIRRLEPGAPVALVPELREQWGFTLAEAQLAQQLMRGCSLEEAAQRVSVSKNTVRSQLRSLFMKTETHRQAELVRVLLTLSHA
jgi:DNA-binding CsgD family transcriptional regulator